MLGEPARYWEDNDLALGGCPKLCCSNATGAQYPVLPGSPALFTFLPALRRHFVTSPPTRSGCAGEKNDNIEHKHRHAVTPWVVVTLIEADF